MQSPKLQELGDMQALLQAVHSPHYLPHYLHLIHYSEVLQGEDPCTEEQGEEEEQLCVVQACMLPCASLSSIHLQVLYDKRRSLTRLGIEPRTLWEYTRCSNQLSYQAISRI